MEFTLYALRLCCNLSQYKKHILQEISIKLLEIIIAEWLNMMIRQSRSGWKIGKPLTNSIAVKSANLPQPLPLDPADRIIIATALSVGAPWVTKDEKLLGYSHIKSIW
jgi:predicted nucleic acid-binding protein